MIEIRITDPANTSADDLQRVAQFLLSYTSQPAVVKPVEGIVATIAHDDSPAVGAPIDGEPDAATVGFGQAPMPPAGSVPNVPPAGSVPNVPPVVASVATPPLPVVPGSVSTPDAVPSVPNVTGVNVDTDGLPWDARIHARTKEKNADGRWRRKRGVEDAVVSSVEAELRQVLAIPNPMAQFKTAAELGMVVPSVPPVPVVPSVPTAPLPVPSGLDFAALAGNVPNVPTVPTVTPSVSSPPPVQPVNVALSPAVVLPASAAPMTFATLLPKVTSAVGAQQLTHERVAAVLAAIGLPNLPTLAQRPDLVSVVHDQLFPPAAA